MNEDRSQQVFTAAIIAAQQIVKHTHYGPVHVQVGMPDDVPQDRDYLVLDPRTEDAG